MILAARLVVDERRPRARAGRLGMGYALGTIDNDCRVLNGEKVNKQAHNDNKHATVASSVRHALSDERCLLTALLKITNPWCVAI